VYHQEKWCIAPEGNWNGAKIVLRPCTDNKTRLVREDFGTPYQKLRFSEIGKCLDVPAGDSRNGVRPQVWDCYDNGDNQKWFFKNLSPGQTWYPVNAKRQCLDVKDGKFYDGAEVQFWECNEKNRNQIMGYVTWW
jgi:hypothetical protein